MRIIGFLVLVVFVSACGQPDINKATQSTGQITLPGWVVVSPGIEKQQMASQKGQFSQTFDEFVGGLIDAGMDVTMSTWLKPTYGNQNLLWVPDGEVGEQRRSALVKSRDDFNRAIYAFRKGVFIADSVSWEYAGYMDKSAGEGSSAFNSYVFVCGDELKGVSVFYWGDGIAVLPYEMESVETLLNTLSPRCKN